MNGKGRELVDMMERRVDILLCTRLDGGVRTPRALEEDASCFTVDWKKKRSWDHSLKNEEVKRTLNVSEELLVSWTDIAKVLRETDRVVLGV